MTPDLLDPTRALDLIRWANGEIRSHIHRTPVLQSRSLSKLCGVPLRLKCENLQRGGSFKLRGALTRAYRLNHRELARGLVTYSSGNHAQGVALAASLLGTSSVVVLPNNANPSKIAALHAYGADVRFVGHTVAERRALAEAISKERDMPIVPPFDDPYIIAGQGTVGLEIMEEWPDTGAVFVPIGGGGLISGIALAVKARGLGTRVIGVEPEGAARTTRSLERGSNITLERTDTIADGLRAQRLGELNWEVIRRVVDEVVTVSDAEILQAMRLVLERVKVVSEPSGAVAVAGALEHGKRFPSAIAVVSGGNLDVGALFG